MIDAILHKQAWRVLYQVFSEQQNQEAMDTMDSVLQAVTNDLEERNALQDKETSSVRDIN